MKNSALKVLVIASAIMPAIIPAIARETPETADYWGLCDASAAVSVSSDLFIVANDEDNVLRLYRRGQPGKALQEFDLNAFLATADGADPASGKMKEVDIEGAARIGNRIYWIASHGAEKGTGAPQPSRRQLFATEMNVSGEQITLKPVGEPYRHLLEDLVRAPEVSAYGLDKSARQPPEQVAAPDRSAGLNIEGLGATPQGALLIAFRNPIPDQKALIVPLKNPDGVIHGQAAQIGAPLQLQLGGRGVRSLDYVEALGDYLVLAGPADDTASFSLYRWPGPPSETVQRIESAHFEGMQPEAFVAYPDRRTEIQVLSDDGDRRKSKDTKRCKKNEPQARKFRSIRLKL